MRLRDGRIRKLRKLSDVPGEAHELTFSCYRRLKMLSRDRTRLWLIEALDAARHKHDFELWAYVIMPEHAHVLLYPRRAEYDTGAIRQLIKQPVGQKAINWLKSNDPAWLNELRKISADGRVHYLFWQPGGGDSARATAKAIIVARSSTLTSPFATPTMTSYISSSSNRTFTLLIRRKCRAATNPVRLLPSKNG